MQQARGTILASGASQIFVVTSLVSLGLKELQEVFLLVAVGVVRQLITKRARTVSFVCYYCERGNAGKESCGPVVEARIVAFLKR